MKLNTRSKEIDFLRGIAVILVLFSHHYIWHPINEMGWIGVDLFFVLSGFLVSGLLFTEYLKFGNVKPKLFLIRRGFKIYPLFYFSIFLTVILFVFFPDSYVFIDSKTLFLNRNGILTGFLIESFFLQSYLFGYWGHHWSLSVEEIFYFSLAFLVYKITKNDKIRDYRFFYRLSAFVFVVSLLMRVLIKLYFPEKSTYSAAHLRMDSLFFGVFISYNYYFRYDITRVFYSKFGKYIKLAIVPLLSFTPFVNVTSSPFIQTIGFTLLYLGFGGLLVVFLFEPEIEIKIQKISSKLLYKWISIVGFYSYSIYLFHTYVMRFIVGEGYAYMQYNKGVYTYLNVLESFFVFFILSIFLGIGMSKIFEIPMLRLREKHFPKRGF